ncbi:MAG: DUF3000 family protein, partial [Pseudonocardiaceae bacterium]
MVARAALDYPRGGRGRSRCPGIVNRPPVPPRPGQRRFSATVSADPPTVPGVPDLADAPEIFRRAVVSLNTVQPRPEMRFEPIPAPQRLAPWTYA